MKELFLGDVIRQRRLELGVTQEKLCEGICEPATLSRFENGRQTPSRNRIKALLYRLGLPDDRFYGLLSTQELEIAKLEKEITGCNVRFQRSSQELKPKIREEAIEKHRKLEAIMDQNDNLSKQQILLSCYIIGTENGPYSLEQGLALLTEAIRLTSPKFDLKQISEGIYTEMEIKLINCMATCYFNAGRHEDAIDILKALLVYLQTHLQKLPSDRAHIPMVAFNYARELETVKKYEEAIEIAEYAKRVCIDFGHYQNLPSILMVLAECYYHLGRDAESAELYRQAFYLYKVLEDDVNRSILQEEAKAYLGLNLE